MFATVTIQTYNRPETLAATLNSLRALRCPAGVDYEILVVDNNSTDNTAEVIRQYAELSSPRLRSVFEPKQGLSHARNRALREARGEIVCFLDDDVKVDPGWLEAVSAAFVQYSATVVGGRSYLIYPTSRPTWLSRKCETMLSRLDYGRQTLVNTDENLVGLNFCISRQIALKVGGFDSKLGRKGKSLIGVEEIDILRRVRCIGGLVVYEPKALVGHVIHPERLTKKWFLKRSFAEGVSVVRYSILQGKSPKFCSALIHTIRCWGGLVKGLLRRPTGVAKFFDGQIYAARSLGILVESIRNIL